MEKQMQPEKKRIGIFLLFDTKGKVYEYVEYLLSEIGKCLKDLVVVVNGYLREDGREVLKKYSTRIYERPNIGYDAGGWKDGILDCCGIEKIREYDELILLNDSFFGPFFPFKVIFEKMDKRDMDFWGLSSHGPAPSQSNMCPYGDRPAYIQTYFMAFEKRLINDPRFEQYWREMPYFQSFSEVMEKHGCVITKYFEDLGFKWDVFSDTRSLESDNINNYLSFHMFDTYRMLTEFNFPIIKRKCFVIPKEQYLRYGTGDSLWRSLEYVKNNTDYNTDLIWNYLLDNYNLFDLKQSLNLNCIVDSDFSRYKLPDKSTAIICHLFYSDLFSHYLKYLKAVPFGIDIYITTDSEEKKNLIAETASTMGIILKEIRVVCNRGRELSALLVGCRDIVANYEYLCFLHDKKSTQKEWITVGSEFSRILVESMLASEAYIINLLHVFESNPKLGLLVPSNVYHGTYFCSSSDYWSICYEEERNLFGRLNIKDQMIQRDKPPISVGSVFWCRVKALSALFNECWAAEDFMKEPIRGDGSISHAIERCFPYVAQAEHYYTCTLMPIGIAEAEIANYRYMMNTAMSAMTGINGIDFSTFYNFNSSIVRVKNDYNNLVELSNNPNLKVIMLNTIKRKCKKIMPKPLWDFFKKIILSLKSKV